VSIELLRVDFRIVGIERDEDGQITGERVLGDGTAHPAGLDKLPDSVRKVVDEANAEPETPAP
jgi:hypothetical protein